jgi:predicted RNA-binding protein associated with RNAse of E/G family
MLPITYTYKNGDVRVAHIGRVTREQYEAAKAAQDAITARLRAQFTAMKAANASKATAR